MTKMATRLETKLLSLLTVTAVVLGSAAAGRSAVPATVIPGVGVGGVKLGMSQAAVRSVLGAPTSVATTTGCCGAIRELDYAKLGLTISFLRAPFRRVSWITTTSPLFRTAAGARVGSTKAELSKDVGGVRCGGGDTAARVCTLRRGFPNETSFIVSGGRVVTVIVGLIPE